MISSAEQSSLVFSISRLRQDEYIALKVYEDKYKTVRWANIASHLLNIKFTKLNISVFQRQQ